jgi:hypothetical protein
MKYMWWRIREKFRDITIVWPDNIKRIISFIPILWNDWDFDARPGLYILIKKKLERLRPCLLYGHLESGEKLTIQIDIIIKALDRLIADDYEEEEMVEVDEKWGKVNFWFEPIPNSECFEWKYDRPNMNTEEDKKQERIDYRAALKRGYDRQQRDAKIVFRGLEKLHWRFWD